MSILDGILGNLDEISQKFGIPADTMKTMAETAQAKLGDGTDPMSALMQTMQEHGMSLDQLQAMMGQGSMQDLMGKAAEMFGQFGQGNPMDNLSGMMKGLFGKE